MKALILVAIATAFGYFAPSKSSRPVKLDTSGQWVSLDASVDSTLEFWVCPLSGSFQEILYFANDQGETGVFQNPSFELYTTDQTQYLPITKDQWQHISIFITAGSSCEIFKDLVTSRTCGLSSIFPLSGVWLGGMYMPFQGLLAMFKIWNQVLPIQVLEDFMHKKSIYSKQALVVFYDLLEDDGNFIMDRSYSQAQTTVEDVWTSHSQTLKICDSGYFYDNSECIPCNWKCLDCINSSKCLKCCEKCGSLPAEYSSSSYSLNCYCKTDIGVASSPNNGEIFKDSLAISGDFTLELWVYLISWGDELLDLGNLSIVYKNGYEGSLKAVYNDDSEEDLGGLLVSDYPRWVHIALTYDSSTLVSYRNSQVFSSHSLSKGLKDIQYLRLGGSSSRSTAKFRECRLWSIVKTDIYLTFKHAISQDFSDLEFLFPMREESGNTLQELVKGNSILSSSDFAFEESELLNLCEENQTSYEIDETSWGCYARESLVLAEDFSFQIPNFCSEISTTEFYLYEFWLELQDTIQDSPVIKLGAISIDIINSKYYIQSDDDNSVFNLNPGWNYMLIGVQGKLVRYQVNTEIPIQLDGSGVEICDDLVEIYHTSLKRIANLRAWKSHIISDPFADTAFRYTSTKNLGIDQIALDMPFDDTLNAIKDHSSNGLSLTASSSTWASDSFMASVRVKGKYMADSLVSTSCDGTSGFCFASDKEFLCAFDWSSPTSSENCQTKTSKFLYIDPKSSADIKTFLNGIDSGIELEFTALILSHGTAEILEIENYVLVRIENSIKIEISNTLVAEIPAILYEWISIRIVWSAGNLSVYQNGQERKLIASNLPFNVTDSNLIIGGTAPNKFHGLLKEIRVRTVDSFYGHRASLYHTSYSENMSLFSSDYLYIYPLLEQSEINEEITSNSIGYSTYESSDYRFKASPADSIECLSNEYFNKSSSSCSPCSSECEACQDDSDKCLCKTGYYIWKDKCVSCTVADYSISGDLCISSSKTENCATAFENNHFSCIECANALTKSESGLCYGKYINPAATAQAIQVGTSGNIYDLEYTFQFFIYPKTALVASETVLEFGVYSILRAGSSIQMTDSSSGTTIWQCSIAEDRWIFLSISLSVDDIQALCLDIQEDSYLMPSVNKTDFKYATVTTSGICIGACDGKSSFNGLIKEIRIFKWFSDIQNDFLDYNLHFLLHTAQSFLNDLTSEVPIYFPLYEGAGTLVSDPISKEQVTGGFVWEEEVSHILCPLKGYYRSSDSTCKKCSSECEECYKSEDNCLRCGSLEIGIYSCEETTGCSYYCTSCTEDYQYRLHGIYGNIDNCLCIPPVNCQSDTECSCLFKGLFPSVDVYNEYIQECTTSGDLREPLPQSCVDFVTPYCCEAEKIQTTLCEYTFGEFGVPCGGCNFEDSDLCEEAEGICWDDSGTIINSDKCDDLIFDYCCLEHPPANDCTKFDTDFALLCTITPSVLSAEYKGNSIHIEFDVAVKEIENSQCASYFDQNSMDSLGNSLCIWSDDKKTLLIDLDYFATIQTGPLQFLDNLIMFDHSKAQHYGTYPPISIEISGILIPSIGLSAPNKANNCKDLELKSFVEEGMMGRAGYYSWKVDSIPDLAHFEDFTTDRIGISVPATYLKDIEKITITLTVKNIWGQHSFIEKEITISSQEIPNLMIQGFNKYKISPSKDYYFPVQAETCNQASMSFEWVSTDPELTSLHMVGASTLHIAKGTLEPGKTYSLEVRGKLSGSTEYGSASLDIEVTISPLKVIIIGPGEEASKYTDFSIDGHFSYDPDDPTATIEFEWSCSQLPTLSSTESNVQFERGTLHVGTYTFKLVVRSGTKTEEGEYTVKVIDSYQPNVAVFKKREALGIQNWNLFTGGVQANSGYSMRWSISKGELYGATNQLTVGIAPFSLIPGETYTLTLTVTDYDNLERSSSIDIFPNLPPTNGHIYAYPTTGEELETEFALQALSWEDAEENLPLNYQFFIIKGSNEYPLTYQSLSHSYKGLLSANVSVRLKVFDSLGSFATIDSSLNIQERFGSVDERLEFFLSEDAVDIPISVYLTAIEAASIEDKDSLESFFAMVFTHLQEMWTEIPHTFENALMSVNLLRKITMNRDLTQSTVEETLHELTNSFLTDSESDEYTQEVYDILDILQSANTDTQVTYQIVNTAQALRPYIPLDPTQQPVQTTKDNFIIKSYRLYEHFVGSLTLDSFIASQIYVDIPEDFVADYSDYNIIDYSLITITDKPFKQELPAEEIDESLVVSGTQIISFEAALTGNVDEYGESELKPSISISEIAANITLTIPAVEIGSAASPICTYLDPTWLTWVTDGCSFVEVSESGIVCTCNHLSMFSAADSSEGFTTTAELGANNINTNPEDIEDINLETNSAGMVIALSMFLLYAIGFYFARMTDKRDNEKMKTNDPKTQIENILAAVKTPLVANVTRKRRKKSTVQPINEEILVFGKIYIDDVRRGHDHDNQDPTFLSRHLYLKELGINIERTSETVLEEFPDKRKGQWRLNRHNLRGSQRSLKEIMVLNHSMLELFLVTDLNFTRVARLTVLFVEFFLKLFLIGLFYNTESANESEESKDYWDNIKGYEWTDFWRAVLSGLFLVPIGIFLIWLFNKKKDTGKKYKIRNFCAYTLSYLIMLACAYQIVMFSISFNWNVSQIWVTTFGISVLWDLFAGQNLVTFCKVVLYGIIYEAFG